MSYALEWENYNCPVSYVEAIFLGDTVELKKTVGIKFFGHYFEAKNQKVAFYMNEESAKRAGEFGKVFYKDKERVISFLRETEEIENRLKELDKKLNGNLSKLSNKELFEFYSDFFNAYSKLLGLYRFTRPTFYASLSEEIKSGLPEPKEKNFSLLFSNNAEEIIRKLPADMLDLINLFKEIGKRRFAMHNLYVYYFERMKILFKEISKRVNLNELEVANCTYSEIKELLVGKGLSEAEVKDIKKRLRYYRFIYHEDFFEVITEAQTKEEKISKDIKLLKGQPANPGKAVGPAKVILEKLDHLDPKELEKVKEGDILVASSTCPDMLPAMKKAAAFVTDVGGILSHAAIVSREFNVPCVVGTKIATKVLEDGDVVEIDADKGVVRIISRGRINK